jgi:hypothetical protein
MSNDGQKKARNYCASLFSYNPYHFDQYLVLFAFSQQMFNHFVAEFIRGQ